MCLFPIAIPQPLMRSARNLRLVDFGALPAPPDRKDLQKRELWRSGWPRAYPRTRPAVRGYGPVSLPRSSSSIRSFEREFGPERGHRAPRG